jgi:hypothetical protein
MSALPKNKLQGFTIFPPMGLLQSRKSEVKTKRSPPEKSPAFAF